MLCAIGSNMRLLAVFKLWSGIDATRMKGNIVRISKCVHSAIWFGLFHCYYYKNAVWNCVRACVCAHKDACGSIQKEAQGRAMLRVLELCALAEPP